MRYEMKMPDLATTGSEIRVIRWMAGVGTVVRRGQPMLEIETEKATMEVEATVDGTVQAILASPGDTVAGGQVIASLEVESTVPAPAAAVVAAAAPVPAMPAANAAKPPPKSPGMFARNRAAAGTTQPAPPPPAAGVVPLSPAHQTAARRLSLSKQTVPHFYLQTSFSAMGMIASRKAADSDAIVWDAFFVHAIAKALKQFDRLTLRYDETQLLPAPSKSIGVAVDADGELYVIAVQNPAERTLAEISEEIRDLAQRVRSGDSSARRLPQVCMTLSNLGSCNVESFLPIINPPESAILGFGRIVPTCVASETQIAIEPRGTITMAVDHRVVSGKYAGDFLGAIVAQIEQYGPAK